MKAESFNFFGLALVYDQGNNWMTVQICISYSVKRARIEAEDETKKIVEGSNKGGPLLFN